MTRSDRLAAARIWWPEEMPLSVREWVDGRRDRPTTIGDDLPTIAATIAAARAEEREACAKRVMALWMPSTGVTVTRCAAACRAGGDDGR